MGSEVVVTLDATQAWVLARFPSTAPIHISKGIVTFLLKGGAGRETPKGMWEWVQAAVPLWPQERGAAPLAPFAAICGARARREKAWDTLGTLPSSVLGEVVPSGVVAQPLAWPPLYFVALVGLFVSWGDGQHFSSPPLSWGWGSGG